MEETHAPTLLLAIAQCLALSIQVRLQSLVPPFDR